MRNACYGCKDRHYCCWSDCEKYAEYRKVLDAAKAEREKKRAANEMAADTAYSIKRRRNFQ